MVCPHSCLLHHRLSMWEGSLAKEGSLLACGSPRKESPSPPRPLDPKGEVALRKEAREMK